MPKDHLFWRAVLWPFKMLFRLVSLIFQGIIMGTEKVILLFRENGSNVIKKKSSPDDYVKFKTIDAIKGSYDNFEKFLAILFEKLGYATKIVGSNKGDYGADLIIEKQGERTVVQAKCWHNSVGVKAVQEVYGSLHMHSCTKACVVTNNYFTEQAKRLAEANNVELWDRNTLAKIILSTKKR